MLLGAVLLSGCGQTPEEEALENLSETLIEEGFDKESAEKIEDTIEAMGDGTVTEMPDWVKDFGFEEPKGLTLDQEESKQTKYDEKTGLGVETAILIYTGDAATVRSEAERIAQKAGLTLPAYMELALGMEGMEDVPLMYTNQDEQGNPEGDYLLTVQADAEMLTITAMNTEQTQNFMKDVAPMGGMMEMVPETEDETEESSAEGLDLESIMEEMNMEDEE